MKECKECRIEKPLTEFYITQKAGYKGTDGYVRKNTLYKTKCKDCVNKHSMGNYHKLTTEEKRKRRKNNPCNNFEWRQKDRLKRRFGLTVEQYNAMLEEQDNMCKICGEEMNPPQIDHDHTTGKGRYLLCRPCNTSLGLLKEDTKTLNNMISYINDNLP